MPNGYEVIPPPIGITVAAMPNGAVDQTVNGITYFSYGGAWYQPMYSGGGVTYQVVQVPAKFRPDDELGVVNMEGYSTWLTWSLSRSLRSKG